MLSNFRKESFVDFFSNIGKKLPKRKQLLYLPKILTSREQWFVLGLFLIILLCFTGLLFNFYFHKTQTKPEIGGTYTEGVLGRPRYLNPILAPINDADRDISRIVYSSLLKYDYQGNLIKDLAKDYKIKDDGLIYEFYLKENIHWHDGEKLTADDVVYTIKTIQNSEYNSPLQVNWQGVKVEKINEFGVQFKLTNTYAPFLHNLTVGILPKHLWAGISPENFPLAQYNLKPVGSGPYKFKEFSKDKTGKIVSLKLTRNEDFYLESPYSITEKEKEITLTGPFIEQIIFNFYDSQSRLIEAYHNKKIDGLSFVSAENKETLKNNFNLEIHKINLPEYYAVFFNQTKNKALANKNVRQALSYAVNKEDLIKKTIKEEGQIINSPLLKSWSKIEIKNNNEVDLEKARNLLKEEGWTDQNNDGIREKDFSEENDEATSTPEKLKFEILTTNWPTLQKTAETLKNQWQKIGVEVNIKKVNPSEIQADYIKEREYEALLFGQVSSPEPDPFAFWHSSQIKHPGLNLALYENKKADKLLEEGRQTLEQEERLEKYKEFQSILLEETPAIFLYSPNYLYPVQEKIKGISIEKIPEPSFRFSQIENWYIKTKRVWK